MTLKLVAIGLLGVASIALNCAAQAPAERPPFATTKVAGTDNVYIFRNGNHQSMFVVTPEGVIARLNAAMNKALADAGTREQFLKSATEPVGGTPADIQKFFVEERARWKRAVEVANLQKLP